MSPEEETIGELEHLTRYHRQAACEFFGDVATELAERTNVLAKCLKERAGTRDDIRHIIELLVSTQENLRKRVEDLNFLTSKMIQRLAEPGSLKKDLGGLKRREIP